MERENVWHYPRPPRVEPVSEPIRIVLAGLVIAETTAAQRVLETTHPPVYYLPRGSFTCDVVPSVRRSFCEWKGLASYWSLRAGSREAVDCGWSYPDPAPGFAAIRDHIAVYPAAMDACYVGDEKVTPQPGGFYGGWVTSNLDGPFKGAPGTMGW
jgi:uncharacterized protein (DUF427 family)